MVGKLDKYQQIIAILDVGLITATALIASIGNTGCFENGKIMVNLHSGCLVYVTGVSITKQLLLWLIN